MKKEDFQKFFKQRMAEIMHKDTLDSYRVRANNAHTILKELGYVMEGWIAGNIKRFETVELCINETISLVEKDNCLVFTNYSKELFLNDLDEYNKKSKNNLLAELKNRLKISIFLWRKKLCISLIFSNFVVSNYKVIYFTLCTTCMQIS